MRNHPFLHRFANWPGKHLHRAGSGDLFRASAGSLNFRAEFFNVFNHPNFNLPVSTLSSGAFGRFVNNATAPRIVQFALKVTF